MKRFSRRWIGLGLALCCVLGFIVIVIHLHSRKFQDPFLSFQLVLNDDVNQKLFIFKNDNYFGNLIEFDESNLMCLKEGSDIFQSSPEGCVCKSEWMGKRCAIPVNIFGVTWMQDRNISNNIVIRKIPRRIIVVSLYIGSAAVTELLFLELYYIVDVFILGDSSQNKSLLEKVKDGWLQRYHDKIIYIPVPPELLARDFDECLDYTVNAGLHLISNIRPDDVIVFTKGEEVIKRENLLFLKIFNDYPMPVNCRFQSFVYGFFWKEDSLTTSVCAISVNYYYTAYLNKYSNFKENITNEDNNEYLQSGNIQYLSWEIPDAGYQCQFCQPVKDIFLRIAEWPKDKKPMWLTSSPNEMIPFIQRLIKFGQNFEMKLLVKDDILLPFIAQQIETTKYNYVIVNPFHNASLTTLLMGELIV